MPLKYSRLPIYVSSPKTIVSEDVDKVVVEPEPEPVVQKKVEADDLVDKPKKKVVKKVKKSTASTVEYD